MPSSISVALVSPSARTKKASLIIGSRIRLTRKPGPLLTVIGDLPSCNANVSMASCVASLVCRPRTISTRAMTGTGLKKCIPMKRSGYDIAAASLVIEIEDVLDAMIVSARTSASTRWRSSNLTSQFSVTAKLELLQRVDALEEFQLDVKLE